MSQTCEGCAHFRPHELVVKIGYCRRFPPAKPSNFSDEEWVQPIVRKDGACGEHKPK